MLPQTLEAFAALGLAVLFLAGLFVLGIVLVQFTRALTSVQALRRDVIATDAQAEVLHASRAAVDELDAQRAFTRHETSEPTDAEIRAMVHQQTLDELAERDGFDLEGSYPTVEDNAERAGYNGRAEIEPDRLYADTET